MRGIDVTTTADANLLGAADEKHVEFASAAQRVIYTQDSDFVKLHDVGLAHVGIVDNPGGIGSIGDVVRHCA